MSKSSLEELVNHDPSLPMYKGVGTIVSFLWKSKVCKAIHPLKILAVYGGMGSVYCALPKDQKVLRGGLLTIGMLPIVGSAFLTSMAIWMVSNKRRPASSSAKDLLLERLKSGRAERKLDKYDVYFPEDTTKPLKGMIYFPGALVHHTAYAGIAAALSDRGILVIVLSLEPVRFVADVSKNREIAKSALDDFFANHGSSLAINEWVLAGHSAGAMSALNVAIANERFVLHPSISKIVLCGIGRNETQSGESLRDCKSQKFSALVINGTNDALLKQAGKREKEEFERQLPPLSDTLPGTKHVWIEGGNHSQFGDYGAQKMGGEATISMEEQQKIFIESTAAFLLQ